MGASTTHPSRTPSDGPGRPDRTRAGGRAIPRWATVAAYAVPVCVLPSAAWRMAHAIDALLNGGPCEGSTVERVYVASLSVVSMSAALLTIGLVKPWGETVPSWIPIVGGRRVSVRGATIAALTGATLIALLCGQVVLDATLGDGVFSDPEPGSARGCDPPGTAVMLGYLPLLAWPPLLYAVTWSYYRRRRHA